MVGVGIFGIPFVFAKAGFIIGLGFLLIAAAVTLTSNLMFAEVVLRTPDKHQLVGYANRYLGPFAKRIMLFTNTLGIYGALLAYINVAGDFLNNIFSSWLYIKPEYCSIIFFVIGAWLLLFRFRTIAAIEFFMTGLFIAVIVLIFGVGVPEIRFANLTSMTLEFWFLPYGVLLFAFGALTSIPLQREILGEKEHLFRPSILTAVGLVGVLYLLFAFTVVGISGDITSPDALSGLIDTLGTKVVILGSLFGVLAIFTSFLMLGSALKNIFHLDYGIRKRSSWLLVIVPPLALFLIGMRSFIQIIELVGAVAIGIESIVLIFMYIQAKRKGERVPEFTLMLPRWLLWIMIILFSAGIIYVIAV
jgi:amino acid permease